MDSTHQKIKLSFSHIPATTQKALDLLSKQDWIIKNGWYLAGGTALTLQFDHRTSVDLDFFTHHKDFDAGFISTALLPYKWVITRTDKGTLYGELEGTKISFIAYPYFVPKQPFITYNFINILDAQDIAVMKIIAISQRGKKRDFFDLYWYITQREPLLNIIERVATQYPNLEHNYHHIIKSLMFFEEAEEDPEPQIFFDATWEQVKQHFISIVPSVADKLL
ncbi:MAG: nucleotidyl transferase AbiEii/AbiGii toxin family protein [bacterium]|nr:nucleotidyl transferase AbiEii/AbiGii toxin family protein [bacterium]